MHAIKPPTAFRPVPRTGVIYVTTEAQERGFRPHDPLWCNLGQGQPETGALAGAAKRVEELTVRPDDQEYAPTVGLWELRDAVASLYNQLFRRGMRSQYSAENVCIAGGGRTLLTRAAASLGQVNLGHFLPDYTAYEELLDIFKAFTAIPILLEGANKYEFSLADLRREIVGRGLSGLLFSNPCNPTGKLVDGEVMADWVRLSRELDCTLLIDEFYSHYVYSRPAQEAYIASAARYVEDVERDPVLLFDGFTKNWRYPGWRVSWAVGPRTVIEALASAGSFLDGGGSKPLQRAALPLLDPTVVYAETSAIQTVFRAKRDYLLKELSRLGVQFDHQPEATFYAWGSVATLPTSISEGMSFFRAALDQQVITVPGEFFDVNPGKRRKGGASRFKNYVRFSFGPQLETLTLAINRLEHMIGTARG
ncbi:MAG: pyridoxal phosphate-dependent aminotransferase [Deltaproteobacteria bacterium]|nr:pyridoxal phosphate-dependent aminotransferase [Deltaproteobacteria bacterium]